MRTLRESMILHTYDIILYHMHLVELALHVHTMSIESHSWDQHSQLHY